MYFPGSYPDITLKQGLMLMVATVGVQVCDACDSNTCYLSFFVGVQVMIDTLQFFFLSFPGPHPCHMEVPRLGV